MKRNRPETQSPRPPLQCPYCDRKFTRHEHRERHVHSHTKTKPFTCAVCKKRFGRRDVYQRHLRSQHPDEASIVPTERRQGACDNCHSRKVKCNSAEHPCERCHREGIECTFQRTLSDSAARDPSQIDHLQTAVPEINLNESFLNSRSLPNVQDWHDVISGSSSSIPNDILPPLSPSFSLPFQDATCANEFALLDFDFIQPSSFLDVNLFDQLPPFPSLDLLPAPAASDTRPDSRSSRIRGAFAQLQVYTSPTELSRPASPGAKQDHENWLHRLGKKLKAQYDPLVVNVFLNLSRLHVATTFRCFEAFTITDSTPVELWTSMASVGALYCTTPGSMVLAKSLYNHARIILLSKVHHRRSSPKDDQLAILQTYMLLEIFGYLSGDDRFHEIAEVYHWEMIQIISTYNLWSPSQSGLETQRKRTIEGICILECYRVTILHSAATFSMPFPSLSEVNDSILSKRGIGGPVEEDLLAQLRSIMSPTLKPPNLQGLPTNTTVPELWSLSCLSLLLPWASVKNRDEQGQTAAYYSRRGEMLESALHQWFRETNGQAHISTVMLFHMICLNLHVNVRKIQNIVHQHLGNAGTPCTTNLAMETGTPSLVNLFSSRIDRQNAIWHAEQIIELAVRLKHDELNGSSPYESTHFTYCVFFAALTIWYTNCQSDIHGLNDLNSRPRNCGATNLVRTAVEVLSGSHVHIAKKFISTLGSLVANPLSR